MIQDDTRSGAAERLIAWGGVGILTGALVFAAHASNQANSNVRDIHGQFDLLLAGHQLLMTERDGLIEERRRLIVEIDRLKTTTPTERIVMQPCVEADPTPVFSRDSQFTGSRR